MSNTETPTTGGRRIVANFMLSADGVMESPEKWTTPYFDPEIGALVGASFAASDTLLMGSTLYREWAPVWPAREGDLADAMNGFRKYVVSSTITDPLWANTTVISGDVGRQLRDLKQQPGKDIAVSGSATLVKSLIREDLLDELSLLIFPVLVGTGRRLFTDDTPAQALTLASSRSFATGAVHLAYRPATT